MLLLIKSEYITTHDFLCIFMPPQLLVGGHIVVWFLLGPYYFFFHFLFRFVSLISFCFRWFRFISFSFRWFRFVSFLVISLRFVSISLILFRFVSFLFRFALYRCPAACYWNKQSNDLNYNFRNATKKSGICIKPSVLYNKKNIDKM